MSDEKRCLILSKNATQQKRSREKWDDKKKQQENASANLRMQKTRALRKEAVTEVNVHDAPSKSLASTQSLGKVMKFQHLPASRPPSDEMATALQLEKGMLH